MKRKNMTRRVLSMLLVLMMFVSLTVPALAEGEEEEAAKFTWEKVDNGSAPGLKPAHKAAEPTEEPPLYADTDTVRVSIVLDKASTLEKGFATRGIADNASAMSYRDSLKAAQANMEKVISALALGGKKLDVVWNLTLVANIISANVKFGQIEAIKNVKGVKDVVIETVYSPLCHQQGRR